jgi:cysteine-S-conjugate beta-lyase
MGDPQNPQDSSDLSATAVNVGIGTLDEATLRGSVSNKWNKFGPDVAPAWVADMDFSIAPCISSVLREYADRGFYGYPVPTLIDDVKGAFATWWQTRFGLSIDPSQSIVLTEVVQAIHAVVSAFTQPNDGVLVLTPIYPPFLGVLEQQSRRLVEYRMILHDSKYRFDVESLRALIKKERPKILLLCNPHNPVGRVFTIEELRQLGELAVEFDMLILSDEIHADLVFSPHRHVPIATLGEDIARRTFVTSAVSKSFNLAGLRCAMLSFGSPELKDRFDAVFTPHTLGIPSVAGLLASLSAWTHGGDWLRSCVDQLRANRDLVMTRLTQQLPEVGCASIEGTYLAWLDFSAYSYDGFENIAERIRSEAKVALNEGPTFGTGLESYARLNIATSPERLVAMVDQLATALQVNR